MNIIIYLSFCLTSIFYKDDLPLSLLFHRIQWKTEQLNVPFKANSEDDIAYIRKIINKNRDLLVCIGEDGAELEDALKNYYHLYDVNNDKQKDLIYSGYCGEGHSVTYIFLQIKENIFEEIFYSEGDITDLFTEENWYSKKEVTELILYRGGCCGASEFNVYWLSMEKGSNQFTPKCFVECPYDLLIPFYADDSKEVKITIPNPVLRSAPIENDKVVEDWHEIGNIIKVYKNQQILYVMNERSANNGKWAFVFIPSENSIGDIKNPFKSMSHFGWVKIE